MPEFWTLPKVRGIANEIEKGKATNLQIRDCDELIRWIDDTRNELVYYRSRIIDLRNELSMQVFAELLKEMRDGIHEEPGD